MSIEVGKTTMGAIREDHVVVIGAGVAGLTAALALAACGIAVTVIERAETPGGKIRQVGFGNAQIDSGPTVFTMRWVFDEVFAAAGREFSDYINLQRLEVLARHAWTADQRLDLFADQQRTTDAIATFAGADEARRYQTFCADTQRIYDILEKPFLRSARPSMLSLLAANGLQGLIDLPHIKPFTTMWNALGQYFHDPRLRQLFARYATYCGSSPFLAPATLMLIAHVERQGVWSIEGGMHALARALAACATELGATIRYGQEVQEILTAYGRVCGVQLASGDRIASNAVIVNADVSAITGGLLGHGAKAATPAADSQTRSLSAITWSMVAKTDGFPLSRHSVFFSQNYRAEFHYLFNQHALPREPTVYVCAQDRTGNVEDTNERPDAERLFVLVNAPPTGDRHTFDATEVEQCTQRAFDLLERCGLRIHQLPDQTQVTTPTDFNRLFPATGGALYGRSSHGWTASFQRPGSRTRIPGLYLAGGSTHPGPGVPMAALSGRSAAASLMVDLVSTGRSRKTAMHGGMSTR